MSQEDRVRISKYFKLFPNYGWGVPREGFDYERYYRHLPVSELNKAVNGPRTDWDRFARRTPGDPAWNDIHLSSEGDSFGVPTLWAFSWYDISVAPNVALYNYARKHTSTARAQDNQQMIIGPLPHCQFGGETQETVVGERNLGDARFDYTARYLEWFDHWLKGEDNGATERPTVRYYQMGANAWMTGDRFPLPGTTHVDLYLDSEGHANSLYGDGVLGYEAARGAASDGYIYDPLRPVPTHGGGACCMGTVKATGSYDQSSLEMRSDILVYTTPVLEEDLVVAGFVEIELYVSSDARDTYRFDSILKYTFREIIITAEYRLSMERREIVKSTNHYIYFEVSRRFGTFF